MHEPKINEPEIKEPKIKIKIIPSRNEENQWTTIESLIGPPEKFQLQIDNDFNKNLNDFDYIFRNTLAVQSDINNIYKYDFLVQSYLKNFSCNMVSTFQKFWTLNNLYEKKKEENFIVAPNNFNNFKENVLEYLNLYLNKNKLMDYPKEFMYRYSNYYPEIDEYTDETMKFVVCLKYFWDKIDLTTKSMKKLLEILDNNTKKILSDKIEKLVNSFVEINNEKITMKVITRNEPEKYIMYSTKQENITFEVLGHCLTTYFYFVHMINFPEKGKIYAFFDIKNSYAIANFIYNKMEELNTIINDIFQYMPGDENTYKSYIEHVYIFITKIEIHKKETMFIKCASKFLEYERLMNYNETIIGNNVPRFLYALKEFIKDPFINSANGTYDLMMNISKRFNCKFKEDGLVNLDNFKELEHSKSNVLDKVKKYLLELENQISDIEKMEIPSDYGKNYLPNLEKTKKIWEKIFGLLNMCENFFRDSKFINGIHDLKNIQTEFIVVTYDKGKLLPGTNVTKQIPFIELCRYLNNCIIIASTEKIENIPRLYLISTEDFGKIFKIMHSYCIDIQNEIIKYFEKPLPFEKDNEQKDAYNNDLYLFYLKITFDELMDEILKCYDRLGEDKKKNLTLRKPKEKIEFPSKSEEEKEKREVLEKEIKGLTKGPKKLIIKESEEAKKAREETERKTREEAERKAREEAEKKEREEADRKAQEETERKTREEAERKAREEAEKKEREEADRKAREEVERKAQEETEKKSREETERKAREEEERKIQEEVDKINLLINNYDKFILEIKNKLKTMQDQYDEDFKNKNMEIANLLNKLNNLQSSSTKEYIKNIFQDYIKDLTDLTEKLTNITGKNLTIITTYEDLKKKGSDFINTIKNEKTKLMNQKQNLGTRNLVNLQSIENVINLELEKITKNVNEWLKNVDDEILNIQESIKNMDNEINSFKKFASNINNKINETADIIFNEIINNFELMDKNKLKFEKECDELKKQIISITSENEKNNFNTELDKIEQEITNVNTIKTLPIDKARGLLNTISKAIDIFTMFNTLKTLVTEEKTFAQTVNSINSEMNKINSKINELNKKLLEYTAKEKTELIKKYNEVKEDTQKNINDINTQIDKIQKIISEADKKKKIDFKFYTKNVEEAIDNLESQIENLDEDVDTLKNIKSNLAFKITDITEKTNEIEKIPQINENEIKKYTKNIDEEITNIKNLENEIDTNKQNEDLKNLEIKAEKLEISKKEISGTEIPKTEPIEQFNKIFDIIKKDQNRQFDKLTKKFDKISEKISVIEHIVLKNQKTTESQNTTINSSINNLQNNLKNVEIMIPTMINNKINDLQNSFNVLLNNKIEEIKTKLDIVQKNFVDSLSNVVQSLDTRTQKIETNVDFIVKDLKETKAIMQNRPTQIVEKATTEMRSGIQKLIEEYKKFQKEMAKDYKQYGIIKQNLERELTATTITMKPNVQDAINAIFKEIPDIKELSKHMKTLNKKVTDIRKTMDNFIIQSNKFTTKMLLMSNNITRLEQKVSKLSNIPPGPPISGPELPTLTALEDQITQMRNHLEKIDINISNIQKEKINKNDIKAMMDDLKKFENIINQLPSQINQILSTLPPKQLPQQIPQQIHQQIHQQISQQLPQQLPQQLSQQLPQQIPQQLPQQLSQPSLQPILQYIEPVVNMMSYKIGSYNKFDNTLMNYLRKRGIANELAALIFLAQNKSDVEDILRNTVYFTVQILKNIFGLKKQAALQKFKDDYNITSDEQINMLLGNANIW